MIGVDRFREKGLASAEGQQLGGEDAPLLDGLKRRRNQAAAPRLVLCSREKVETPQNHRQEIVEVVGNAAGELAERLHALRFREHSLGVLAAMHFVRELHHREVGPSGASEGEARQRHQSDHRRNREDGIIPHLVTPPGEDGLHVDTEHDVDREALEFPDRRDPLQSVDRRSPDPRVGTALRDCPEKICACALGAGGCGKMGLTDQKDAVAAYEASGMTKSGQALPVEVLEVGWRGDNQDCARETTVLVESRAGDSEGEAARDASCDGLADEDRPVALTEGLHVVPVRYIDGVCRMTQTASARLSVSINKPDRADLRATRGNLLHQEVEFGGVLQVSPAWIDDAVLDPFDGELKGAEYVLGVALKGQGSSFGGDVACRSASSRLCHAVSAKRQAGMIKTAASSTHRSPMVLAEDACISLSGTHGPLGLHRFVGVADTVPGPLRSRQARRIAGGGVV